MGFRVGDGAGSLVETVLIPAEDKTGLRKTLCISSQVGCALDCSFCSTGKQGFQRDLAPDEIIGQLWVANQSYMEDVPVTERTRSVTNVVMMGMGEPLLNYDAVLSSMHIMLDDFAYGMSKRRVTLSTSGVVPKIDQLAQDIDVAPQFLYMRQMMNCVMSWFPSIKVSVGAADCCLSALHQ